MRLTVVYNPKAGARGWPRGAIQERLEAAGHEVRLVSGKGEWKRCLDQPADAFVAAGGDGTVHKLARALAGTDRPLAILPLGTANNLARAFGYAPGSDPFARVHDWGERERTLRVECARSGEHALPFLEVLGAGAFARLLDDGFGKKRAIPLDSLMAARRDLMDQVVEGDAIGAEAVVDGEALSGRFVMIVCLRIPSFGPALWLAPEQRPDEAEFTVVGVRNDQREPFAWWLATGEGDVGAYRLARGRRIELSVPGPVHVDDHVLDPDGDEPRTITMGGGEGRVRVLV